LGEDGATHQILEDIGLMKMLPGMTVINTCDYNQTKAATLALADHHGPAPKIWTSSSPFMPQTNHL
jgi:transketolase